MDDHDTVTPDLERQLQRLEDVQAIHNLMGRRAYLHSAGLNDRELLECWATEAPDVSFEAEDWGVWDGWDHIWHAYVEKNPFPAGTPGLLIEHALTTPVIEVAEDGLTAKGVWISPGHETFPMPDGPPAAHWSWGRYGVDFLKEDGDWRIWHLHVYTTLRTPYDQDWVDSSINRPAYFPKKGEVVPGMPVVDRPVTFNRPYALDAVPVLQPPPPEPYATWQDTTGYTDPPKEA